MVAGEGGEVKTTEKKYIGPPTTLSSNGKYKYDITFTSLWFSH
jgi:hypothetical protein